MPRVILPSQAVSLIETTFSWTTTMHNAPALGGTNAPDVSAIVAVLDQIPDELLPHAPESYTRFVHALAALQVALSRWTTEARSTYAGEPIRTLRNLLRGCPDQFPPSTTAGLSFITDTALREGLRLDIAEAERALSGSEWKGATVLAGSVVEALLLWKLQDHESNNVGSLAAAVAALQATTPPTVSKKLDPDPLWWHLHEYTEVAVHLNIINKQTADAVRLARGFRNLIHPGVAQRIAQRPTRATALSAVAAVEHVVNNLTP